jgi:hypothetical protein
MTDLDLLLDEADKAVRQGTAVEEGEQQQEEEEEGEEDEYDALEHMARILRKNPVPPRTFLTRITTEEDREEVFRRRGLELVQKRRGINEVARPRILNGAALVICVSCEPQEDGLSTHEQFASDILVLEKALPLLGFEYVDVKKDLTRAQIMDTVFETCQALCPGGNLQDADGVLLLIMSTGGPTSFDSKPGRGANKLAQGACQIGFQEIINLVKVIPQKPKIVLFNVCGDPEERKRANFDVPLQPSPCNPNLYQKMLDGCYNVLLALNVTSGKLNWVPKAGSLFLRFLLEEIKDEGINKDLADLVIGVRTRLLEYFFARRGTGKPNCPVGRAEYHNFFLQTPLFTAGTSDCPVMLGPALKFAKELCGASFIEQESFFLINIDTIVVKDKHTDKYVHGYGIEMPRTCEGVEIDLEKGTPNLGWQFVVHAIDDSEEVYIGAAVLPKSRFTRVPSFGRVVSNVSKASSVVSQLQRVPSNASQGKGIHR